MKALVTAILISTACTFSAWAQSCPSGDGTWSQMYFPGMRPVHAVTLYNDRVLVIDQTSLLLPNAIPDIGLIDPMAIPPTHAVLLDERTRTDTYTDHWLFCSGHCQGDRGELILRGGGTLPTNVDDKFTVYIPSPAGGPGEFRPPFNTPRTTTQWRVRIPGNENVVPPGYYMLFIAVGENGCIPCVRGQWIRVYSQDLETD